MAKFKIELLRSLSGRTHAQRETVKGLGLRKRHQTVIIDDTPAFRGMIDKIAHMVRVEELED